VCKRIRLPGDSIATIAASYKASIYRWHFLFAEDGFVMRSREWGAGASGSSKWGYGVHGTGERVNGDLQYCREVARKSKQSGRTIEVTNEQTKASNFW